jgi:hypothetical protein
MMTFTLVRLRPVRFTRNLAAALALMSCAGCYRDLDISKIACDVNEKGSCPDGYQCAAGKCVQAPAVLDASNDGASPQVSTDSNGVDGAPVGVPDAAGVDSPNITPAETGSTTSVDSAADFGGIQGGDSAADVALGPSPDAGTGDLPLSSAIDASDAPTVDLGNLSIDADEGQLS